MKKHFFPQGGSFAPSGDSTPKAKAVPSLVDAFCDNYSLATCEEYADEVFSLHRLRSYFGAFIVNPKLPDPLPPYLDELEKRGFALQTTYDERPALFLMNRKRLTDVDAIVIDDAADTPVPPVPADLQSADTSVPADLQSADNDDTIRTGMSLPLEALVSARLNTLRTADHDQHASNLPWEDDRGEVRKEFRGDLPYDEV